MAHNRVTVRFTKAHEDSGVLYQAGQEADVTPSSADYIEQVAKAGHRVVPPAETPKGRGVARANEE